MNGTFGSLFWAEGDLEVCKSVSFMVKVALRIKNAWIVAPTAVKYGAILRLEASLVSEFRASL